MWRTTCGTHDCGSRPNCFDKMRYRHTGLGSQEELGAGVPSEAYSRHRGEPPQAHYPSPRDRAQSPTTTNGFVWTLEWAWNEDQKVQAAVQNMGYRGQSGHVDLEPVPMCESGSRLASTVASIQAPPQTSRLSMATGREQTSALVLTSDTALVPTQSLISSSSSSECDENSVRGRRRRRRPICKQPLSSGNIRATQPRIHRPTEDADGSVSETSSVDEPMKTKTEVKDEDSRLMPPVAPSDGSSIKESATEALGKLSMGNHSEHDESLPGTHERGWVCMICTLINLESAVECEACGVAQE
ncbi:hypothetical protein CFIMG_003985RAa [Ceratocystis fimbriata CBS 114723]|uniref:RanBP2-type domain-containing protein n=1 Tax=Ceratocystis fimbriata CBS 114723 TaxID=1035309 RepID=A0A2C5WZ80_9PEZI|nr:hypothetical protein CFIMG_003985RAa [Ceratocystis fimbriata CBS 114723]